VNEQERVLLAVVMNDEEAVLIAGALRAEGIEVFVDSRTFKQEPVRFGLLGDVRLWIHETDEARARALLAELEAGVEDYVPEGEDPSDESETPKSEAPGAEASEGVDG